MPPMPGATRQPLKFGWSRGQWKRGGGGGVWFVDLHAIGVLCYRDVRGMPQMRTGSDVKIVDLRIEF